MAAHFFITDKNKKTLKSNQSLYNLSQIQKIFLLERMNIF